MRIYAIYYTDDRYASRNKIVYDQLNEAGFDRIIHYNRYWIECSDLYKENKQMFSERVGGGYWLWKPYIILDAMKYSNLGDVIFYTDAGDDIHKSIGKVIRSYMLNHDYILTPSIMKNRYATKRDCFIEMGCDSEKYWDHIQLEAGTVVFKNIPAIGEFIANWLMYNSDMKIVDDSPCTRGENFKGWRFHRHNQSILTNLAVKYEMEVTDILKQHITYNVFNA